LHASGAAVVRRKGEMPVLKHAVEGLEVFGRGASRFLRVRTLVDIPIVLEAVLQRGAAHELPDALGLRFSESLWLERALDQWNLREIERQALGTEDLLNHGQEGRTAPEPFLEIALQTASEQLNVGQDSRIQRNLDVVGDLLEVLRDRLLGFFACRRWRLEGGNRQELVNRRSLGAPFPTPV